MTNWQHETVLGNPILPQLTLLGTLPYKENNKLSIHADNIFFCHVPSRHMTPEPTTRLPVCISCPDTSGTHPATRRMLGPLWKNLCIHYALEHDPAAVGYRFLFGTTSGDTTCYIHAHFCLRYSTLWSPFSISPDLFHMKHIVSIYTQMFPPVSPVWISTSVPPVSFSVRSAFPKEDTCVHEGATHELKPSPSASRPLRSSSDPLPIRFRSFPALLPQPAPVPNPICNIFISQ